MYRQKGTITYFSTYIPFRLYFCYKVLERNFRLKLSGPDYKDKDPAVALSDFRHRVANYERAYETVGDWEEENDIQYCKLVNVGKKVIAFNISGYLSGQCIFYLMNFNLAGKQANM